ncbi:MAG: hypothetical protein MUF22_04630 [Chitinispirillaceae bacterium]|jgi:hypothetical protein|nr:hypothetical protein [Chitinispirillaceae bacterium]
MDAIGQCNASIEAINTVLENAMQANLRLSEKIMALNVATKLGAETGKGQNIDLSA